MEGYTDIHSHIIPGVDDGAADFKEAERMLLLAYKKGTRNMILTPHYGRSFVKVSGEVIEERFQKLKQWANAHCPDMQLYLGREVAYTSQTRQRLEEGRILTLCDSHYVLLEFRPEDPFSKIREGVTSLQAAGYWVILAHAERCQCIAENIFRAEELAHMGICIQINGDSIFGKNGISSQRFVRQLLKRRLVHFVASDGHDGKVRRPVLHKAERYIRRHYGKEYSEKLTITNQEYIFRDVFLG